MENEFIKPKYMRFKFTSYIGNCFDLKSVAREIPLREATSCKSPLDMGSYQQISVQGDGKNQ